MASRRRTVSRPSRTGLRSQRAIQRAPQAEETDDAWENVLSDSSEEEEIRAGAARTPPSTVEGELLALMKTFLAGQQQREEGLLQELRGLRVSLQHAPPAPTGARPAQTPSTATASSPQLDVPTPAPRRHQGGESSPLLVSNADYEGYSREPAQQHGQRPYAADPKIPPYQTDEDIENYLLRFERIAHTWKWPETEWACRLIPLLSGKALEAYTAMDEDRAHCYRDLKDALMVKFNISPETYKQQFRAMSVPAGETPTETYHRLKGLYRCWIRPDQLSKEQIGEQIILEQLLRVFPPEVRTWVKEHEPSDGATAAKLALQHRNVRQGGGPARFVDSAPRAAIRPASAPYARAERRQETRGNTSSTTTQPAAGKTFVCYYCQQSGHKASVCPVRRDKMTGSCYAPRQEAKLSENRSLRNKTQKTVTVNGQQMAALLDSGSFTSLVKKSLLPVGCVDYSTKRDIVCVHGDRHAYPKAEIVVTIDEQSYMITVGVVDKLPVDLILGTDLPVLLDLLQEENTVVEANEKVSCPVVTRAHAKAGLQPLPDLDDSLCEGGTKGTRKSRRQRRFEKQLNFTEPDVDNMKGDEMWNVPENISELQRQDETLKPVFAKVGNQAKANLGLREQFIIENDVLYVLNNIGKRLVIPVSCHPLIMHLAHTLPWAGHFAHHKTFLRISARFYWPNMYTDIKTYCTTCPTCQKTCPTRRSDRALLHPLPIISTPFRRIAMDIVGLLVKSGRGHQYILVVCDYATRFPEAFPLQTITAPAVLRALIQLFSRV